MKQSIKLLLGGAFLLSLPMFLTSCEDILGEWSKPTPSIVTPSDGGGSTEGIAYVKYTVSGTTATPSDQQLAEGTYTVVTADLAELTADKPYVVNADVTIDHNVIISGNAEIILCDGKTLTINGYLGQGTTTPTNNLTIYGQTNQTGKLIVRTTDGFYPIPVYDLNIHGGDISAKDVGTGNDTEAIYTEHDFNIYNGKVEAFGTMEGVMINVGGELKIYGGSLEATTSVSSFAGGQGSVALEGTITVYGGTVTATGGDANVAGKDGGAGIDGTLTVNGGTVTATGGNGSGGGNGGIGIQAITIVTDCVKVTATGGDGTSKGACCSGTVTPANTLKYSFDDGASYTNSDGSAQNFSMITSMIIIPQ